SRFDSGTNAVPGDCFRRQLSFEQRPSHPRRTRPWRAGFARRGDVAFGDCFDVRLRRDRPALAARRGAGKFCNHAGAVAMNDVVLTSKWKGPVLAAVAVAMLGVGGFVMLRLRNEPS